MSDDVLARQLTEADIVDLLKDFGCHIQSALRTAREIFLGAKEYGAFTLLEFSSGQGTYSGPRPG